MSRNALMVLLSVMGAVMPLVAGVPALAQPALGPVAALTPAWGVFPDLPSPGALLQRLLAWLGFRRATAHVDRLAAGTPTRVPMASQTTDRAQPAPPDPQQTVPVRRNAPPTDDPARANLGASQVAATPAPPPLAPPRTAPPATGSAAAPAEAMRAPRSWPTPFPPARSAPKSPGVCPERACPDDGAACPPCPPAPPRLPEAVE